MTRTLEYYLACPYRRVHELCEESDGSRYYARRFAEMPGVIGTGETPAAAAAAAFVALGDFLTVMMEVGAEIPDPIAGTSAADALFESRMIHYPSVVSLDPPTEQRVARIASASEPDPSAEEGSAEPGSEYLRPLQQSWMYLPALK